MAIQDMDHWDISPQSSEVYGYPSSTAALAGFLNEAKMKA
jgi:hypothetical protein